MRRELEKRNSLTLAYTASAGWYAITPSVFGVETLCKLLVGKA